jgi:hypothetical protein
MARRRFVAAPSGGWVEVGLDYIPEPKTQGTMIMPDIKPYQSMIDGREISSRSVHRAHLRQHGFIEVGNERPPALVERAPRPEGLRQDMQRAWDQLTRR